VESFDDMIHGLGFLPAPECGGPRSLSFPLLAEIPSEAAFLIILPFRAFFFKLLAVNSLVG